LRALDQLIAGEKHICLLGASSPIDQTRRSGIFGLLGGARGLAAAAMVMWVLLAVGHWPLVARCFRWHESYIIVGIVQMHIPNVFFLGLKYLDRSKFYSGCPDTPNNIQTIL
jgi:hypothetical protein